MHAVSLDPSFSLLCKKVTGGDHLQGDGTLEEEEEEEWGGTESYDDYLGDDGLVTGGYGNLVVEILRLELRAPKNEQIGSCPAGSVRCDD